MSLAAVYSRTSSGHGIIAGAFFWYKRTYNHTDLCNIAVRCRRNVCCKLHQHRLIAATLTPLVTTMTSAYLRTDTTREFFFKRKLINYTKNELQGINILKLRLPNGLKCCLNFFIVGMGNNVK